MKSLLKYALAGLVAVAASTAVGQTKSATETTTKSHDSKVKTLTVVGTVKKFEAGKKIVVTGPKKKNYSFDLDENATVGMPVNIGDHVKVTYTKGSHGYRATVVSPSKPSA